MKMSFEEALYAALCWAMHAGKLFVRHYPYTHPFFRNWTRLQIIESLKKELLVRLDESLPEDGLFYDNFHILILHDSLTIISNESSNSVAFASE